MGFLNFYFMDQTLASLGTIMPCFQSVTLSH